MTDRDDDLYPELSAVVLDPAFPAIDLRLRAGVHIGEDDLAAWAFLKSAHSWLSRFYAGFDCRLHIAPEGYAWLVSEGDLLGHRRLSRAEMLSGQVLALMAMDPAYLRNLGGVPVRDVLTRLELLVGPETLAERLVGRQRGTNRVLDTEKVREAVLKALGGLQRLGFLEWNVSLQEIRPRRAILRFAEVAREASDPAQALARLVAGQQAEVEPETRDDENEDSGDE